MEDYRLKWELTDKIEDKKAEVFVLSVLGAIDSIIALSGAGSVFVIGQPGVGLWAIPIVFIGAACTKIFGFYAFERFEHAHKSSKELKQLKLKYKNIK